MNISPAILERLAIDKAMGELSEDVQALLEAVAAENPQARAALSDQARTVAMARDAMAPATPRTAPLPRLHQPILIQSAWRRTLTAAAMAACLVIGIGFGRNVSRMQAGRPATYGVQMAMLTPVGETSQIQSSLWDVSTLIERANVPRQQAGPKVTWESPVMMPTVEISQ